MVLLASPNVTDAKLVEEALLDGLIPYKDFVFRQVWSCHQLLVERFGLKQSLSDCGCCAFPIVTGTPYGC